jgi:hypothetical protein
VTYLGEDVTVGCTVGEWEEFWGRISREGGGGASGEDKRPTEGGDCSWYCGVEEANDW